MNRRRFLLAEQAQFSIARANFLADDFAEIVGSLTVVISVIYLALQISENTRERRARPRALRGL